VKATSTATSQATGAGQGMRSLSMLGGERFYTFARWLTIVLLFPVTQFLTNQPLWPLSTATPPLTIVLWAYVGFSLLATAALLLPGAAQLLSLAFIVDLMFISLMAFFGGEQTVIFFPLYLLPLINAAIRQPPAVSLLSGVVAAVFYLTAFIGWRRVIALDAVLLPLDYVALGLRGLTLTFVPWITSNLAERWAESNRQSVVAARRQAEQALVEAQAYRDEMRSLYEVAYTLSTTVDYRQVLEATLRESRKLVPFTAGFVLVSAGAPNELYIIASESLTPADQERRVPVGPRLTAALRSTDPTVVADLPHEAELGGFESLARCRSACLFPLRANLRTYGLMVMASDAPGGFTRQQVENLSALANYAIIALHNAELIFDLKAERTKLISKEEEVRHQLARDLHDGPAQSLAAITMNVEFIKRLLARDPARVLDELDKLSLLARRTTEEVRTMLFELRPLVLETQGLRVTLEQYMARFMSNSAGTTILLDAEGAGGLQLETKTEGTLFNIIQEAVNNALKHARAERITVRLQREGATLITTIADDGRGFDMQAVMHDYEKRGSFGLLNIDERARLVGGSATISSTPGAGTTVTVIVPVEP
jgi:signal transduction histidine kinase